PPSRLLALTGRGSGATLRLTRLERSPRCRPWRISGNGENGLVLQKRRYFAAAQLISHPLFRGCMMRLASCDWLCFRLSCEYAIARACYFEPGPGRGGLEAQSVAFKGGPMSASSSHSALTKRAIARIRRLCCLGLGGEIAIPALLGELHALIPSTNNYFMWAGPDLELANFYGEGDTLQSLPLYLGDFVNSREQDVVFSFPEVMRNRKSEVTNYHDNLKIDLRTFQRHDFYNLILRPHGIDFGLQIKLAEHGRGL